MALITCCWFRDDANVKHRERKLVQKCVDVSMEDDMIDGLICLVTTLLMSN